jgi:uncharacterized protein (TIRG00374 family)
LLAWALHGFGGPALAVLEAQPSPALLAGFLAASGAAIGSLTWRWRFVLYGSGQAPGFAPLLLFRSAGHALAVLVPSGKVGGDPLRVWLLTRAGVAPGEAIASVAVDRTLEAASTAPFGVLFAALLLQHGIPGLERAFFTLALGAIALGLGIAIAARRLRRGAGLVTALAGATKLGRLRVVESQQHVLLAAETAAARLVGQPARMRGALLAGIGTNLLVVLEFALLFAALGLPTRPIALVAAIFATGAAHTLPIPAGLGALEGAQMWLFGMLGYPAHVGLAAAFAARLRDLLWMLPGLLYLLGRSAGSLLRRLHAA